MSPGFSPGFNPTSWIGQSPQVKSIGNLLLHGGESDGAVEGERVRGVAPGFELESSRRLGKEPVHGGEEQGEIEVRVAVCGDDAGGVDECSWGTTLRGEMFAEIGATDAGDGSIRGKEEEDACVIELGKPP